LKTRAAHSFDKRYYFVKYTGWSSRRQH